MVGLIKARGGLQDRWRLSVPNAVFLGGNYGAGGQEGLVVYWAVAMLDLQIRSN